MEKCPETKLIKTESGIGRKTGRKHDGGWVGECGVHLSPQMHQDYLYI